MPTYIYVIHIEFHQREYVRHWNQIWPDNLVKLEPHADEII